MKNAISSKTIKNIVALRDILEEKKAAHEKAQAAAKKAYRAWDRLGLYKRTKQDKIAAKMYYQADDRVAAAIDAVMKAEEALLRELLLLAPKELGKEVMKAWIG